MANIINNAPEHSVKSILWMANDTASSVGAQLVTQYNTTLNYKYELFPNERVESYPKLKYFGLGIKGAYNVDDENMSAPYIPKASDMDLYEPIPLRCVPIEEDLSAAERETYRIRVKTKIGDAYYYCYYLKKIVMLDSSVQLTRTNPTTNVEEPYELLASNLNPTPVKPLISGENPGTVSEINARIRFEVKAYGREVLEYINVKYGDMRRAKISEIGIYSGMDKVVEGLTANNTAFSYTEAIYTQLAYKICNLGNVVTNADTTLSRIIALGDGNTLIL